MTRSTFTTVTSAAKSVRRTRSVSPRIRGGTIVGEHSVLFCGRDEIIEIKHTALSREVFAVGAVDAAAFMAERTQPGIYDMSDVIASHK